MPVTSLLEVRADLAAAGRLGGRSGARARRAAAPPPRRPAAAGAPWLRSPLWLLAVEDARGGLEIVVETRRESAERRVAVAATQGRRAEVWPTPWLAGPDPDPLELAAVSHLAHSPSCRHPAAVGVLVELGESHPALVLRCPGCAAGAIFRDPVDPEEDDDHAG